MLRIVAVICALALASTLISPGRAEESRFGHATREVAVEAQHKAVVKPHRPEQPQIAASGPIRVVAPSLPTSPPAHGTVTGRALPRFAALRANKVNMRVGPGLRYRIKWVYQRRDLPIEIVREFYVWRLVQDPDGVRGWMHQATLVERRCLVVTGGQQVLRSRPDPHAAPVARLNPGVIGRVRQCAAGSSWCRVEVDGYRGWLPRRAFWGTLPGEAVHG